MRYRVVNETDGLLATPETFTSPAAAEAAISALRERFENQGYYLTSDGRRISPEEVRLRVVPAASARG